MVSGFNIYVLGEPRYGKNVRHPLLRVGEGEGRPVPPDRAYVFNFREPEEPIALSLARTGRGIPAGHGGDVDYLRSAIPKVFDSKEYEGQKGRIVEGFQSRQKEIFGSLEEEAKSRGFNVRPTINGFSIVAVDDSGEPMTEEKFSTLDDAKRRELRDNGKRIQERLDDVVRIGESGGEGGEGCSPRSWSETAALSVLGHRLEEIRRKHRGTKNCSRTSTPSVRTSWPASKTSRAWERKHPPRCRS